MKTVSKVTLASMLATYVLLIGCSNANNQQEVSNDYSTSQPVKINLLSRHIINNNAAYIPSQCYTKTEG